MQELTYIFSCVLFMLTKKLVQYDVISGGGYTIPLNSTAEALASLIANINFIGFWLQSL